MNDTEELQQKIASLEATVSELRSSIRAISKTLSEHGHDGRDGSERIRTTIELAPTEVLKVQGATISGNYIGPNLSTEAIEQYVFYITIGGDEVASDGVDNAQVFVQHYTQNSNTFLEANRSPIHEGYDGRTVAGESTISTSAYKFENDKLAGSFIDIRTASSSPSLGVFPIVSNTVDTITFTGSSPLTSSQAYYYIFTPMYLGSGNIPWRRVYAVEGTAGGLRFGFGGTGDGKNGLLYMDEAGDLYWRDKTNSSTKLN